MNRVLLAASLSGLLVCSTAHPGRQPEVGATPTPTGRAQDRVFTGMCDASGAVALSATLFAVADDEDNVLRVYDADRGGPPLATSDIGSALPSDLVPRRGKRTAKRMPEMDIEAATKIGEVALWITSHGRSSSATWAR